MATRLVTDWQQYPGLPGVEYRENGSLTAYRATGSGVQAVVENGDDGECVVYGWPRGGVIPLGRFGEDDAHARAVRYVRRNA